MNRCTRARLTAAGMMSPAVAFIVLACVRTHQLLTVPCNIADKIQAHFSPRGGCTDAAVAEIAAARSQIRLEGYTFTSRPIENALAAARRRGVDVELVLDARSNRNPRKSLADEAAADGITVLLDARHAIYHDKVILIDGETVVTGSFNFSAAAESSNAENLVVIHDAALCRDYLDDYAKHRDHADRLKQGAER